MSPVGALRSDQIIADQIDFATAIRYENLQLSTPSAAGN